MNAIPEQEFVAWAETVGIGLEPGHPKSAVLRFETARQDSRFWEIPKEPERRSYFFASILDAVGDWNTCAAWRAMGSWPALNRVEPSRVNDVVEARLLAGLSMPLGTADIVRFTRDETDSLLGLLFLTSVFGWSVGEDLYVIPNTGRYILKAGHHGVVYVTFRNPDDVAGWTAFLADRGFCLPDHLPDPTFTRPDWMGPSSL